MFNNVHSHSSAPPKVAFISGLINPSLTWFSTHYAAHILAAIEQGHHFVIGPAPGIDTEALEFLHANTSPTRITIYVTDYENVLSRPRLAWHEKAGGKIEVAGITTDQRDAQATADSDYDILRYFTEQEARECYGAGWYPRLSATEKNERRRKAKNEAAAAVEEQAREETKAADKKWKGRLRDW